MAVPPRALICWRFLPVVANSLLIGACVIVGVFYYIIVGSLLYNIKCLKANFVVSWQHINKTELSWTGHASHHHCWPTPKLNLLPSMKNIGRQWWTCNSGILWKMLFGLRGAGQYRAYSYCIDARFWLCGQRYSHQSFCRAHPVPPCTREQTPVLLMG